MMWKHVIMVVLLYSDISNFTFQNVKILNFFINFLDELGNFKQKKKFALQNVIFFFYILQQWTHMALSSIFFLSKKISQLALCVNFFQIIMYIPVVKLYRY